MMPCCLSHSVWCFSLETCFLPVRVGHVKPSSSPADFSFHKGKGSSIKTYPVFGATCQMELVKREEGTFTLQSVKIQSGRVSGSTLWVRMSWQTNGVSFHPSDVHPSAAFPEETSSPLNPSTCELQVSFMSAAFSGLKTCQNEWPGRCWRLQAVRSSKGIRTYTRMSLTMAIQTYHPERWFFG